MKQISRWITLLLAALLIGCSGGADDNFSFEMEGDTTRDLSGGAIVYGDSDAGRRQVVFQKMGSSADDVTTLTITLPEPQIATTYELDQDTPVSAVTAILVERAGGQTRQFTGDIIGELTLTQTGDVISGSISYIATDILGSGEPVTVSGSFTEVEYTGSDPIESGPSSLTVITLIVVFLVLVLVNVGLTYFIGQAVYKGKKDAVQQSLRIDLLLIRGWRVEGYRPFMFGYVFALLALGAYVIILTVLLLTL